MQRTDTIFLRNTILIFLLTIRIAAPGSQDIDAAWQGDSYLTTYDLVPTCAEDTAANGSIQSMWTGRDDYTGASLRRSSPGTLTSHRMRPRAARTRSHSPTSLPLTIPCTTRC
jgi:hypothetical protein